MNCPNCHSENRDGAKYCDECGFPLSGRIAELASADDEAAVMAGIAFSSNTPLASEDVDGEEDVPAEEEALEEEASEGETSREDAVVDAPFDNQDASFDSGPSIQSEESAPCAAISSGESDGDTVTGRNSDVTRAIPARSNAAAPSDLTADLSGIEHLVDGSHVPSANAWRSGDTMRMKPIGEEAPANERKEFRTADASGGKAHAHRFPIKTVAIVIAVLALIAAVAALVTYQMEIWGGHTVPDVVGSSQADATYELQRQGFAVRATQVKSDDVEGKVLLTDPSAGSRKAEGSEVVIHVSVSRTVPEVVGISQDEAAALFEAEECTNVEYQLVKSDEAEGTVVSVDPVVGTKVKANTAIVVQVATPYTVPDVAGMDQDEAEAAIAEAGFSAEVKWVYTEDVDEGLAVSTDPASGTKLASGSTVVVSLAKSRAKELVNLTYSYFQSAGTLTIGGVTYELDPDAEGNELSVKYQSGSTVSYSIRGRVVEYVETLFFGTQTFYGDWQTLTGTVTWSDNDTIASASPSIS